MKTSLKDIVVLVVDDDKAAQDLLRHVLEDSGALVTTAGTVEDALDEFRCSPAHVVVPDILIGNSDGYGLLKAIHQLNIEYRGYTPVIAVTGFASSEDRQRAMSAGFADYIAKPFTAAELVAAVERLVNGPIKRAA